MIESSIVWVIVACFLGFVISAIFSGWVKLSRNLFLIPYVAVVGIFLYAFVVINHVDVRAALLNNWLWGVLAGALISIFLVINVRSQPASRQSVGVTLAIDVMWPGLVYGLIDALFLNVVPVAAILLGTATIPWAGSLLGKIFIGIIGLIASLLVTLFYHLGYPEFRSKRVLIVLIGNSLMTLAYIVSGNPLGSIISHPVMHIAAVLHGPETTIQLPPHNLIVQ